jgi:predicted ATP-dependent endonuclease of OLD family
MYIEFVEIRNFRKLRSCRIDLTKDKTVFVGANNSGKTSAMDALILFLKERSKLSTRDFTLSNWKKINEIGKRWTSLPADQQPDLSINPWEDVLPQMDIWLRVSKDEIHYISDLIPTLDWDGTRLGLRLRFEPKNIEVLFKDYTERAMAARKVTALAENGQTRKIRLWPKTVWDFLERLLTTHFGVKAYILDEARLQSPVDGVARPQMLDSLAEPLGGDPLPSLIKVDIINAQRGFSDPNNEGEDRARASGNLSHQLREYYARHLNPMEQPTDSDLDALQALEDARESFDSRLLTSFGPALKELEQLNVPGFGGNPAIRLSSRVSAIECLSHASAVQFELLKKEEQDGEYPWGLPEKYNGLGYQNLISMVFKLIRFRDEWMQVGKLGLNGGIAAENEFQPLHLVLVEEPEAHLHAQVQQVFIRKAYDVLRPHDSVKYGQLQTQLVVSTHSNHISHEIDFTSLRYFRRRTAVDGEVATSTVTNLSTTFGTPDETTRFAVRYLRSTHSDLFFADAVILVEGQAERMLVPHFIRHHYPELLSCYISILEIGGRHAFRLRRLLQDLGIVTLVITDLDSIDPANKRRSVLPEKGRGYQTGNTTISGWLPGKKEIDTLLDEQEAGLLSPGFPFRVAFQQTVTARYEDDKEDRSVVPYTFEAALALQNRELFRKLDGGGLIGEFKNALNLRKAADANETIYKALNGGNKAEFALELLFLEDPEQLKVPEYIAKGLRWLHDRLTTAAREK